MMVNYVDYFEIGILNVVEGCVFYGDLFGWIFGEVGLIGYVVGVENLSGLWGMEMIGGGNWVIFYVYVDDVVVLVEKVVFLGVMVLMLVVDIGMIYFVYLVDFDGN